MSFNLRTRCSLGGACHDQGADVTCAVDDVKFIHADVWVSMGESKEVWKAREWGVAFEQAENRMHTIKALLVATLGG